MLAGVIVFLALQPSFAASTKLRLRAKKQAPMSGDVMGEVREQLAADHRTLGNVSASLMSVQSEVDRTERSMLGRVLDLQTARTFFDRHEEIDVSNVKLKQENGELNTQVEGLSKSLSEMQKKFVVDAQKYRESEGALKLEIEENDALLRSMNAELAKEDDVKAALRKLQKIHKELLKEEEQTEIVGRQAQASLDAARQKSLTEAKKHRDLRAQLINMNNYSTQCFENVEKATKKLGMVLVSESKDNEASKLTLEQKLRANDAAQQRLLSEHALIVSQVKKAEREGLNELDRVKHLQQDYQTLEANILKEIEATRKSIEAEKERVKTLRVDLMANAQAEEQEHAKKVEMDIHLEKLIKEIHDSENPIVISQTQGQNDALHMELIGAHKMYREVKRVETAMLLKIDEMNSAVEAAEEALKTAEENVIEAQKEGEEKVEAAVKKAEKSIEKSRLDIAKAEGAVAKRCKPTWDDIWKGKRAQLVKCKALKEELTMELAKKESLTQVVMAQATSP